jgi:hypothetical protein
MSPFRGKKIGKDPSKLLSHFHPRVGRNKERAGKNISRVGKTSLQKKYFVLLSRKIGLLILSFVKLYIW